MRYLSPARSYSFLICFAFLLMNSPGLAQSPPATRNAPPPPPPLATVDQEQFLSYWTSETGWKSELQLRNNAVGQDLTITPALRLADGAETLLALSPSNHKK